MSTQREADLLEAMKYASLPEQRRLTAELDEIRANETLAAQADRDTDLADAIIRDHLTPVLVHGMHSAATDWLGENVSDFGISDLQEIGQTMRAEASVWYAGVSDAVKANRGELREQARGVARRLGSQYGQVANQASSVFLDYVGRLVTAEGTDMANIPSAAGDSSNPDLVPWSDEAAAEGVESPIDGDAPPAAEAPTVPEGSGATAAPAPPAAASESNSGPSDSPPTTAPALPSEDTFATTGPGAADTSAPVQASRYESAQQRAIRQYLGVEEGQEFPVPGEVDPEQDGEAESSLPYALSPADRPDTFPTFIPPTPASADTSSTRAPNMRASRTAGSGACPGCGNPVGLGQRMVQLVGKGEKWHPECYNRHNDVSGLLPSLGIPPKPHSSSYTAAEGQTCVTGCGNPAQAGDRYCAYCRKTQDKNHPKTSEYHYVKPAGGGKYKIVQKGTGKTLSTHDSKEEAEAAFRGMEMHMHSSYQIEAVHQDPWEDAYGIAYIGASNPKGVENTLNHWKSQGLDESHPAVRAIQGHLDYLNGKGLGPEFDDLEEVLRHHEGGPLGGGTFESRRTAVSTGPNPQGSFVYDPIEVEAKGYTEGFAYALTWSPGKPLPAALSSAASIGNKYNTEYVEGYKRGVAEGVGSLSSEFQTAFAAAARAVVLSSRRVTALTYGDLTDEGGVEERNGKHFVKPARSLVCKDCGDGPYSAHKGDYWNADPKKKITCGECGGEMGRFSESHSYHESTRRQADANTRQFEQLDQTVAFPYTWSDTSRAPAPSGAADVGGVPTPGAAVADYPQPGERVQESAVGEGSTELQPIIVDENQVQAFRRTVAANGRRLGFSGQVTATLVPGDKLNDKQRENVLNAFPYRWTHENRQRTQAWGPCKKCDINKPYENSTSAEGHSHPTIPLKHDEEWLRGHSFHMNKRDELSGNHNSAEPNF